jgi:hypothetical protein
VLAEVPGEQSRGRRQRRVVGGDPADPLVDCSAGQAGVDHRLANGLQGQRAETRGERGAIEAAEGPERVTVIA